MKDVYLLGVIAGIICAIFCIVAGDFSRIDITAFILASGALYRIEKLENDQ